MRFTRIRHVERTGSTNDDVAKHLGEKESRGLTLVADYQTRGAGRRGRDWIAPPGSALLFTTALPDPVPSIDLWVVPFWIGLAVHEALKSFGVRTQLQWPNDVLLDGKKVAGILCVSRVSGDEAWVACGIGINVLRPSEGHPLDAITPPPAFLSDVRQIDRNELLGATLRAADASYDMLRSAKGVADAWNAAAGIPGARYCVRLDSSGETIEGEAFGLGAAGELILEDRANPRAITQADARVLR